MTKQTALNLFLFSIAISGFVTAAATRQYPGRSRGSSAASRTRASQSDWPMFGRDLAGSHYNSAEKQITAATVGRLKPRWIFETGGDLSGQPIVAGSTIFFGSWDGREYAVDSKTGKKLWEFEAGKPLRSASAYAAGAVYFGDLAGWLYAIDASTGNLKWKVLADSHPDVILTSAPIVFGGRIYIGISSKEESENDEKQACCTFRGGVAAYDIATGQLVWRFYTIPTPAVIQKQDKDGRNVLGPSGAAVWSTVSVRPETNRLFFTSGNQYTGPDTKYADAIVALDLRTGKPVWSYQPAPSDVWRAGCVQTPADCGPDADFGTLPLSFKDSTGTMLLGATRKDGWFWAVNPRDGKLRWKAEIADNEHPGKIYFANSTDGSVIFAGISNAFKKNKQGFLCALDTSTKRVLWRVAAPDRGSYHGPITIVGSGKDELVFAGSTGNHIYAHRATDGKIVWEWDTSGSVAGGATVVDGVLYVGSGYGVFGIGTPNNKVYAFSIDGK